MLKAEEGCAVFDDFNEQTFVQFGQWAYTGNYVIEDPVIEPGLSLIDDTSCMNSNEEAKSYDSDEPSLVDHYAQSIKRKELRSRQKSSWRTSQLEKPKKDLLWDKFLAKSSSILISKPDLWQLQPNRCPSKDYQEILLSHARIYVFADKYDIGALVALSLHKLWGTLARFTLCEGRPKDIINLMRYVYLNTCNGVNELQKLIIQYAACKVELLYEDEEFSMLVEGFPRMGSDLCKEMLKRLDKV